MNRLAMAVFLAAGFAAAGSALAQDALIVAGAGFVGLWDTELEVANVSPDPVDVILSIEGLPVYLPCPINCTSKAYTLPGRGTLRVLASDFIGTFYPGPQMVRVRTDHGAPLPVVHARSIGSRSACQFAELPVVRLSSLESLRAPVLVFPGAARGPGVYSNLILQSVGGEGATVEVELLDSAGDSRGTAAFLVPGDVTGAAFTLVDVAGHFGVAALEDGQVRARALSGTGTLWGLLAIVDANGSMRIAAGANP